MSIIQKIKVQKSVTFDHINYDFQRSLLFKRGI